MRNPSHLGKLVFTFQIILCTELLEKRGVNRVDLGDFVKQSETTIRDTLMCPRELVEFYHRRIPCDCLKDIYYELKVSTKRTSICYHCECIKETKDLLLCCCGRAQYCSVQYQSASWPSHKEFCKKFTRKNGNTESA
jgi:hypothetical protein